MRTRPRHPHLVHLLRARGLALALCMLGGLSACEPMAEPDDGPPPLQDGWTRLEAPPLHLPAGTEKFFCIFGTFEELGGIADAIPWTSSASLHLDHLLLRAAPDDVPYADGEVADCQDVGAWWYERPPLVEGAGRDPSQPGLGLPEGVAFPIEGGQRYVLDGHYINVTVEDEEVQLLMDVRVISEEEILWPAGAYSLDLGGALNIPAHDTTTIPFECTWQDEVTLLSIAPHMHEFGTEFTLDWIHANGGTDRLLDIEEFGRGKDDDRDPTSAPPVLTVSPGDIFRTACTWVNEGDFDLGFPDEMCTTIGMGYPLPGGAACSGGGPITGP